MSTAFAELNKLRRRLNIGSVAKLGEGRSLSSGYVPVQRRTMRPHVQCLMQACADQKDREGA
eukprot:1177207-Amphidinium_carterae.1